MKFALWPPCCVLELEVKNLRQQWLKTKKGYWQFPEWKTQKICKCHFLEQGSLFPIAPKLSFSNTQMNLPTRPKKFVSLKLRFAWGLSNGRSFFLLFFVRWTSSFIASVSNKSGYFRFYIFDHSKILGESSLTIF